MKEDRRNRRTFVEDRRNGFLMEGLLTVINWNLFIVFNNLSVTSTSAGRLETFWELA